MAMRKKTKSGIAVAIVVLLVALYMATAPAQPPTPTPASPPVPAEASKPQHVQNTDVVTRREPRLLDKPAIYLLEPGDHGTIVARPEGQPEITVVIPLDYRSIIANSDPIWLKLGTEKIRIPGAKEEKTKEDMEALEKFLGSRSTRNFRVVSTTDEVVLVDFGMVKLPSKEEQKKE